MKKNISIIYFLLFVYSIANAQDSLYFRANAYKEQLDNYYSMDEKDFPKPGSILFIGSSSLGMWKNTGSYFPNHRVLNRAYGGSWISDLFIPLSTPGSSLQTGTDSVVMRCE